MAEQIMARARWNASGALFSWHIRAQVQYILTIVHSTILQSFAVWGYQHAERNNANWIERRNNLNVIKKNKA